MNKWRNVLVHITLWMLFIILATIIGGSYVGLAYFSQKVLAFLSFALVIFYTSHLYLFPRYFQKKEYLTFFTFAITLVLVICTIRYLFEEGMVSESVPANMVQKQPLAYMRYFVSSISVLGVSVVFSMVETWRRQEKELYKWKALKNETDLKFLKSQLRPHFLFNSINNIYSIAIDNEDTSAPLLLEISKMLRYMIYKTEQQLIPIEEEVQFLNSLIKLYALRFDAIPFSEISTHGPIKKYGIPPLILLPFIENIFKHGDFDRPEEKWLLRLSIDDGLFKFEVCNPFRVDEQGKEEMSGIGLSNLRKRLELLYPDSYALETKTEGDNYYAKLRLHLNGR